MDVDQFDKRIVDRLIRQGKLQRKDLRSYLEALPDKSSNLLEVTTDDELMRSGGRDTKLRHAIEEEEDLED